MASIVRAGAANIMAARGADKAPGAALPPPEKPVDPLAGIPDAATAPDVRYVVCAAIAATADYVCTSKESVIARHIAIAPRHGDLSIHAELKRWQESIPDKISELCLSQTSSPVAASPLCAGTQCQTFPGRAQFLQTAGQAPCRQPLWCRCP